jgi:hypothetical protein
MEYAYPVAKGSPWGAGKYPATAGPAALPAPMGAPPAYAGKYGTYGQPIYPPMYGPPIPTVSYGAPNYPGGYGAPSGGYGSPYGGYPAPAGKQYAPAQAGSWGGSLPLWSGKAAPASGPMRTPAPVPHPAPSGLTPLYMSDVLPVFDPGEEPVVIDLAAVIAPALASVLPAIEGLLQLPAILLALRENPELWTNLKISGTPDSASKPATDREKRSEEG